MATGTEVAVTKLMWALGYNVPENHIAYMRREQLVVGEAREVHAGRRQDARAMRLDDLDTLLAARRAASRTARYRIVASKALAGKPIGRIRFVGTRPDDPNDIVPHEDRRELRGYGVFAAWLNHVDAKAINSLDTLVTENGRSLVRHNLHRLRLRARQRRRRPGRLLGGRRVPRRAARGRASRCWRSASTSRSGGRRRSTKRASIGRLPRRQRRLQSRPVEAARAEPGVSPRARGRQVLGGAEARGA